MFIDETFLTVSAGNGGRGCVAFRREKFMPRGGPSGGDGVRGGDVVVEGDEGLHTLLDLHYRKHIKAQDGKAGGGKDMTGRGGEDAVLRVPVGTMVFEQTSGDLLADLTEHGQRVTIAAGGRGGLGNARFARSTRQAPEYAQPGEEGPSLDIRLELKVLADIGFVGFPSVGKSTLISRISNAKPKIADYHFTTLVPNLGMVRTGDYRSFVVADLPGLIEGAHEGKGLGHQFLRHLERTRAVVHLIEVPMDESTGRQPLSDYKAIRHELQSFDADLADRPEIVVLNKIDLPDARDAHDTLKAHFEGLGKPFLAISAVTGEGLDALVHAMREMLDELAASEA